MSLGHLILNFAEQFSNIKKFRSWDSNLEDQRPDVSRGARQRAESRERGRGIDGYRADSAAIHETNPYSFEMTTVSRHLTDRDQIRSFSTQDQ